jgi:hypothetical protein
MHYNYDTQTYEINGDNIIYKDNLDSEYPPTPQHLPNDNLYNNNTDTEPPLLYSLNIFFSLAIFTFTSIQLARCYYKLENYITNQRNRHNNIRRPLNRNRNRNVDINSINTLVVCDELPDNVCSVCLDEFKEEDVLKKLNCNHIFHKDCLEPWLNNNNRNCPLCRTDII